MRKKVLIILGLVLCSVLFFSSNVQAMTYDDLKSNSKRSLDKLNNYIQSKSWFTTGFHSTVGLSSKLKDVVPSENDGRGINYKLSDYWGVKFNKLKKLYESVNSSIKRYRAFENDNIDANLTVITGRGWSKVVDIEIGYTQREYDGFVTEIKNIISDWDNYLEMQKQLGQQSSIDNASQTIENLTKSCSEVTAPKFSITDRFGNIPSFIDIQANTASAWQKAAQQIVNYLAVCKDDGMLIRDKSVLREYEVILASLAYYDRTDIYSGEITFLDGKINDNQLNVAQGSYTIDKKIEETKKANEATKNEATGSNYVECDDGFWGCAWQFLNKGEKTQIATAGAGGALTNIKNMIFDVGNIIFILVTAYLGVKYIWGGVESKFTVKNSLLTLVVAASVFYGWDAIANILNVQDILTGTASSSGHMALVGRIYNTIMYIINIAAVAGIIYIGIRYMMAGADGKSEIKLKAIPVIMGVIMVYGTLNLINFILDIIASVAN